MINKRFSREGVTFAEFRTAALSRVQDPSLRTECYRSLRTAWSQGEDPQDWAQYLSNYAKTYRHHKPLDVISA